MGKNRRSQQDQVLEALARCWRALPGLRLGQLIENARSDTPNYASPDSFYVEDEDLRQAIEAMYDRHVRREKTEGV